MPDKKWFTYETADARDVAAITDDLTVDISNLGTVTIHGWEGGHVHLDPDDTVDMVAVLTEAVQLLRDRGFTTVVGADDRT
ncbi:hypothetical protein [Frondihabitans sp. Leaf304]|uniref:hypothetical protein n=1 Tax=Frondihabitans sp. Leaf304 TaxID=1736329 RepID=UPI0007003586|nr:hypothetical protein [Frondihabitans sp. Leaf304]KQQ28621.1 hypothetical protein ASF54_08215 [Frondihabitans sp. Leaf304]